MARKQVFPNCAAAVAGDFNGDGKLDVKRYRWLTPATRRAAASASRPKILFQDVASRPEN
jgi:hypothetical protein